MGETVDPGSGNYRTVSVRGVGFAPKKQEVLVPPPAHSAETTTEIEPEKAIPRRVGNVAMKAAPRIK